MPKKVVIIGAGGHGKVIADVVRAAGETVLGFLDDDPIKEHCGSDPILGVIADAASFSDCVFLLAIGNNAVRRRLAESMDLPWYTAIHPSAILSPSAVVGEGSVILPNAVVNAEATIGRHCIINTAAVVEHENEIADYVHLSPAVALGGQVIVGAQTHIGIGACVRNNIRICANCTVGAGAVVVNDIDETGTYVGVPARRLR